MNPLISIIVPVYNTEDFLDKCLDSLQNQSYSNIEMLLIENGSKDKSGEICDKHAAKDSRINVVHTDNIGEVRALNMGLDMAKGEYIAFCGCDDFVEQDFIQYLYNNLLKYEADVAVCSYYRTHPDKDVVEHPFTEPIICDRDKAMNMILQDKLLRSFYWDKLYKREMFNELRFPRAWDIAFIYQVLYRSKRTVLLPEPKYHYVVRSTSTVINKSAQMYLDFFNAVYMQTSALLNLGYPIAAKYMVRRGLHTINNLILSEGKDEDIKNILDQLKPQHKSVGILQLGPAYRRRWWMMEHCLGTYKKLYLFIHRH